MGLWPTVLVEQGQGQGQGRGQGWGAGGSALGLCYSSIESLRQAIQTRQGVYKSRSKGLWRKGESSGATQELLRVEVDCDRDTLRFTVRQRKPGFCHLGTKNCWGRDYGLSRLLARLAERRKILAKDSYTAKLVQEPELLQKKLV